MRSYKYKTKRTSNHICVGKPRAGERIPATFNSSVPVLQGSKSNYYNQNSNFEIRCGNKTKGKKCINKPQITLNGEEITNCCYSSKYRNPILGYRKAVICLDHSKNEIWDEKTGNQKQLRCPKDPSGTLYKDNWSKSCVDPALRDPSKNSCYSNRPPTYTSYSRRGIRNPVYNEQYSQYLQRRVRTFKQLEFNFLSNKPIKAKKCIDASSNQFSYCGNEFATAAHNSRPHYELSYNTGKLDGSANEIPDCVPNCKLGCFSKNNTISAAHCAINYVGVSPCDVGNNHAVAVYKRNNPKFSQQGAVSGGSRINRLKYQTILKSQSRVTKTIVSSRKTPMNNFNQSNTLGAENGKYPVTLYRDTTPAFKSVKNPMCFLNKRRTGFGLLQRCNINGCLCPPKSWGK